MVPAYTTLKRPVSAKAERSLSLRGWASSSFV